MLRPIRGAGCPIHANLPTLDLSTQCIQNKDMANSTTVRKPLGVRATPEQRRILAKAAARQNRSVSSFVLTAALEAAQKQQATKPRRSHEEIMAIVRAAQDEIRKANPKNHDLVQELLDERRAEAARE